MTDVSNDAISKGIVARYLAGVDAACAADRGKEHLLACAIEMARHTAGACFMRCEAMSDTMGPKGYSTEAFLTEVKRLCDKLRDHCVNGAHEMLVGVGFPPDHSVVREFEDGVRVAYLDELQRFFTHTASPKGRAS